MTETKLTKRKQQSLESKKNIYDAAMLLFSTKGYDNVNTKDICNEVGVSVGLFYHYFKSKEDIIIEAYSNTDNRYKEFSNSITADSAVDKIYEFYDFMGDYVIEEGVDLVKQVYKALLTSDNEFFYSHNRFYFKKILQIICEGQEKKELSSDISPEEITESLVILSRGIIYDWCLHNGSYDIKSKLTRTTNLFMRSMIQ